MILKCIAITHIYKFPIKFYAENLWANYIRKPVSIEEYCFCIILYYKDEQIFERNGFVTSVFFQRIKDYTEKDIFLSSLTFKTRKHFSRIRNTRLY